MKHSILVSLVAIATACASSPSAGLRLSSVKQRGYLVCGVGRGVAGFSESGADGRYFGLDIDICRAVSAAIFGEPNHVKYVQASSVDDLLRSKDIDIVSRRLTWSLTRESVGLLFAPVTFYDGQAFLVSKHLRVSHVPQLSGIPVCVDAGTSSEFHLGAYFTAKGLTLEKDLINAHDEVPGALSTGRCQAYTADLSELGALRRTLPARDDFDILPELVSKEPLAQVVRREDLALFDVLRWTIFATISAEELGITSTNIAQMLNSRDPDVRRLLGVVPGNGLALGLDEKWAYHVITKVGNYGEIFERNVGSKSPIELERGLNSLWTNGGLIYAPPLR